jgi:hypothetical protein
MPPLLLDMDMLAYIYSRPDIRLAMKEHHADQLNEKMRNLSPSSAVTSMCFALNSEGKGLTSLALAFAGKAVEANPGLMKARLLVGRYLILDKKCVFTVIVSYVL